MAQILLVQLLFPEHFCYKTILSFIISRENTVSEIFRSKEKLINFTKYIHGYLQINRFNVKTVWKISYLIQLLALSHGKYV